MGPFSDKMRKLIRHGDLWLVVALFGTILLLILPVAPASAPSGTLNWITPVRGQWARRMRHVFVVHRASCRPGFSMK